MIVPINFLLHISFASIRYNVLVAKRAVNIFLFQNLKKATTLLSLLDMFRQKRLSSSVNYCKKR